MSVTPKSLQSVEHLDFTAVLAEQCADRHDSLFELRRILPSENCEETVTEGPTNIPTELANSLK